MPRKQDFSQSVIYHIRNKVTKEVVYVGSSTRFQQRKAHHKGRYNHPNDTRHHLKCYVFIRENGGWDCYEVIPVEFLKLENKIQLVIAEQAEMDKQDNLKNQCRAHRTEEQRIEEKKVYMKGYMEEYNKEYLEKNRDKINEQRKEKRECPICKSKVSDRNIARHKQSAKCKSFIKIDLK